MKKSKQILAFEQLEAEMELISQVQMEIFKGGDGSTGGGWEYGMDSSGNLYYRPQGTEDWYAYRPLDEVVITGYGTTGFNYNYYPSGFNWGNYYQGVTGYLPGYYGGGGAGGGYAPANPSNYSEQYVANGQSGMTFLDIVGAMNTSLGLSSSWAQASAIAAELEIKATFSATGKIFAYVDIASNVIELLDSEQSALQHVEDAGQIGVAVALIFAGGPVTIVAGGIALAAWELWEYNRDH